ncbi:MAG: hypothetical protein AB7P20_05505 [Rhizobiaceae bacterium]
MATSLKSSLKLGISTLVLVVVAGSASAQDATAVAERLKSTLSKQGTEIGWASVSGDGGTVTLEGVTAGVAGTPDKVNLGNLTLEGVEEADGGFTIGSAKFPEYAINQDGVSFEMKGTAINGLVLPAEGSTDPLAGMLFYDTADVASINVKMGDKQIFTLEGAHAEMSAPEGENPMEFTVDIPTMSADLSAIPDPQTQAVITELGYQQIKGLIKMEGTWNPKSGQMELSQYDMTVNDAGTLGMTFDLSGYTPEFIKSLQEVQKQMAAQPGGGDQSAQGMAMLGLMQQLVFNSASVTFTDASLTNKVLNYVAKMQGQKPADIANMAKAMVPFGMAQLNNPELTTEVTNAVSAFLDNPKSLTISAEPENPVPFAVLMAGGMGDPTTLPKTLGVSVSAND